MPHLNRWAKEYMAVLWTRAIFITVSVAALITLVVIAVVKPPCANTYGTVARYPGRTLEYPDLCLRFIGAHESQDKMHTYYDFDILDRIGTEKRGAFTYIVSGFQLVQFFRFRGDLYVTEMEFTEHPGGWRDGDVLSLAKITVWDEASAEVSRPDLLRDAQNLEKWAAEHPVNGRPNKRTDANAGKSPGTISTLVPAVAHP